MPCANLHLILADRVLSSWRERPRHAPVRADRPEVVEAFLHGALAPDMGFIPGTDRLVSDAVHYVDTAGFTRRLLDLARTETEEAFAWGWASHVLADVQIHPLVGRAVGERLFGDRSRRIDAVVDVAAHVSLEVGLDIALARTGERPPLPPSRAFFRDAPGIRPLAQALAETYGVEWHPDALIRHHRRAVGLTRWWPRALAFLPLSPPGAGDADERRRPWRVHRPGDRGRLRRSMTGLLRRLAGEGSAAGGFFGPEAPRRWFHLQVLERVGAFVGSFQGLVDGGIAVMANLNLETGVATGVGLGHAATDETARALAVMRGA